MTAQELNAYIDKVLGNSLRCLLPSYWWKRLLKLVVGYAESVNIKADNVFDAVKSLLGVTITTGSGTVSVFADNVKIIIPDGTTRKISFFEKFYIKTGGSHVTNIDTSMVFTSNMTDMNSMFSGCETLTSLDLSRFDTSNVTSMKDMFWCCESLTSLDVSIFDTSNVTNMERMFISCESLTSLDLSNFNTSNVTSMYAMFSGCSGLTSLDLSAFDTSNVKGMNRMFHNCRALTSLDLSAFDTSNVTDMDSMFEDCIELTQLSLGEGFFRTRSVTEIDFSSLEKWEESSFIQSIVTNSYDRTANGLPNITIKLHANTYAYLTDEHKASLTTKGYNVVSA